MKLNLYPWINEIYEKIIFQYKNHFLHHSILIRSKSGIGIEILIYYLTKWLMCNKKRKTNHCGKCSHCKLIEFGSHPDFHIIKVEKEKSFIGIEKIQTLIKKINCFSYQDNYKIVWFPNINQLTENATNSLLKTLEEPPKNTYFFLNTSQPSKLLVTLKSRCMNLNIQIPDEKKTVFWLEKNTNKSKLICTTALRINGGSPFFALDLIKNWEERINFYKVFYKSITSDVLNLIKVLENSLLKKIDWIFYILIDSIKYKQKNEKIIVNLDQLILIKKIASFFSFCTLENSIHFWKKTRNYLYEEKKINKRFILIQKLLYWESIIKKKV